MSSVFALADDFVEGIAALQPTLSSQMGLEGHDDRWGDLSPSGWQATQSFLDGVAARLEGLPPTENYWERLGRRVFGEHVALEKQRIARTEPFRDLNNIASPPQVLRETFDLMPRDTADQWANIASRLESLGGAFNGYIACLEEGRLSGCPVAKRQVEACIQQCETHASDASYFNRLLKQAAYASIVDSTKNRVLIGVDAAKKAYRQLGHYLQTKYLPEARVADAVGLEEYRFASRRFLGTDIDPVATYYWGWGEVVQILEEMKKVGKEIHATHSISRIASLLKTSNHCVVRSRPEFLEAMHHRQQDALQRLDGAVFDIPEEVHSLEVEFAPPGGALGAYYIPPSEDFSRQGAVWYVKPEQPLYPLFDEITTAYHEGFPGHHLQVGVQMCLGERLTRAHRLAIWNEGYGEGWALYAERLMGELGFLERPEYAFGLLSSQMMRACRIVIDIGMHLELPIPADAPFHPGESWTFETAVALLKNYGLLDDVYARSEVTRYLGFPGQAISYKVGEQKILDLRVEAEQQDWFTLKAFHSRVLGSGPVGLDHLREIVLETQTVPVN